MWPTRISTGGSVDHACATFVYARIMPGKTIPWCPSCKTPTIRPISHGAAVLRIRIALRNAIETWKHQGTVASWIGRLTISWSMRAGS